MLTDGLTAPIPALAPVNKTTLSCNLALENTDMLLINGTRERGQGASLRGSGRSKRCGCMAQVLAHFDCFPSLPIGPIRSAWILAWRGMAS